VCHILFSQEDILCIARFFSLVQPERSARGSCRYCSMPDMSFRHDALREQSRQIYGPGTGFDEANGSALHVDAAAHAAVLAIEGAKPGIFNIAEDTGYVSIAKARRELGWDPAFRLGNREVADAQRATAHRSQRV
jgi:hypothetical protein